MSADHWKNKENMVYTYNRMLFNLRKGRNPFICHNMNEPWGRYTVWKKIVIKRHTKITHIWGIYDNETRRNKK